MNAVLFPLMSFLAFACSFAFAPWLMLSISAFFALLTAGYLLRSLIRLLSVH